jgi:hypothetical protein
MTAKKDLKRRVRDRQEKTGESYVTARRHVLAAAPAEPAPDESSAIDYDEMLDLTARGEALGFACRVYSSTKLGRLVDHESLLHRIRDIVHATTEDPDMAKIRAVTLRGEHPVLPARTADWWAQTRQFVRRAMAGIGGISEAGNMLAFAHDGTMVLVNIGVRPPPTTPVMSDQPPRLVLSALVEDGFSMSLLYLR